MSRGPGTVERAIMILFAEHPDQLLDTLTIAARCLQVNTITDAQHTSYRRALRNLARQGKLVDMTRHWHSNRKHWALPEKAASYRAMERATFGSVTH